MGDWYAITEHMTGNATYNTYPSADEPTHAYNKLHATVKGVFTVSLDELHI